MRMEFFDFMNVKKALAEAFSLMFEANYDIVFSTWNIWNKKVNDFLFAGFSTTRLVFCVIISIPEKFGDTVGEQTVNQKGMYHFRPVKFIICTCKNFDDFVTSWM